jgi:hypothetical protein
MNPLLLLLLAVGASAGLTFWQQQSINGVRAKSARLSQQLLEIRSSIEGEQGDLDSARARLKQLEADLLKLGQERAALGNQQTVALPTPEQEGWWPAKRPYFYLGKKYLTQVRFDGRPVIVTAGTQISTNADNPLAMGEYMWMTCGPFSDEGLSPHMAMLLGMTDEEVASVNDVYGEFVRNLHAVEAAHIQRVDPPERDSQYGTLIVARMPVLTSEMQPILDHWEQELDRVLGPTRAGILKEHARRYFDESLDKLGSAPREFLRHDSNLMVRFTDKRGNYMGDTSYMIYGHGPLDWRYSYLFGPGAPCELK